jgi:hypothetical protein
VLVLRSISISLGLPSPTAGDGNGPRSRFVFNHKYSRVGKDPYASGIVPVRNASLISSSNKVGNAASSDGRDVSKGLPPMNKV